jgi:uncharacterized repeat protein (TIGR03803 family)
MKPMANAAAVVIAVAIAMPAQIVTTLHDFGQYGRGARPDALLQAADGNIYGTTSAGGATSCRDGCGTVFKMTPGGLLTTLYRFCSQGTYPNACADGYYPEPGLVQAANGDLYGTTAEGGANRTAGGTFFKITPAGTLTTLYTFCSEGTVVCEDGDRPQAVIQAKDGDFYGTTYLGGTHIDGTVFKITPSGKLTTLYSFCSQSNCTDGYGPNGVIQAKDGDFYGTTTGGGAYNQGTVFRITPSGKLTTLYSFCAQDNCPDGEYPQAGLVESPVGDFYGTTFYGGANRYDGTVFKITPSGVLTTLCSFCLEPNCTDGANPAPGLVLAANGELYGTTSGYGANGQGGTIFQLAPGGALRTLYSFCSQGVYPACMDGEGPGGLVQGANGNFYGITVEGGASQACSEFTYGCGTIFSLSFGPP